MGEVLAQAKVTREPGFMIVGPLETEGEIEEAWKIFQEAANVPYQDILKPGERVRCELPVRKGGYKDQMTARRALAVLKEEGVKVRSVPSRTREGFRAIIQRD